MWWDGLNEVIKSPYNATQTKLIISQIPWKRIEPDLHTVDSERFFYEYGHTGVLASHSFEPQIQISFSECFIGTQVNIAITLKPIIRILIIILTALAMLFEIGFLALCVCGKLDVSFPIFIPILIMLYLHAMLFCGMKLSTRSFVSTLREHLANHF